MRFWALLEYAPVLGEAKVGLIPVMPMAEGITPHKNQQIEKKDIP
jgi:hypothetical protein